MLTECGPKKISSRKTVGPFPVCCRLLPGGVCGEQVAAIPLLETSVKYDPSTQARIR